MVTSADISDDPEYLALVRQFEAELPDKLIKIREAADGADWSMLKSHVHKLKGLGASFGYPDLSDISAQIHGDVFPHVSRVAPWCDDGDDAL